MTNEDGRKPTIAELRGIMASVTLTGEFDITPRIAKAIPIPTFLEDSDRALRLQANDAFNEQTGEHPELTTKTSRLKFIQDNLKYDDFKISQFLGITANQVHRKDLRGRRKKEVGRFEQRFKDLFTITSILTKHFAGYIGATMDRKISLEAPNGKLTHISVSDALENGFFNVAVAVALEAARLYPETMDIQRDNPFLTD